MSDSTKGLCCKSSRTMEPYFSTTTFKELLFCGGTILSTTASIEIIFSIFFEFFDCAFVDDLY